MRLRTLLIPLLAGFVASGPGSAQSLAHLLAVDTAGSQTPHFGLPDGPIETPVTQLRLRFDVPLLALPVSAFRVVEAGENEVLDTLACGLLPTADDVAVDIVDVQWDAALREATLQLDAPRGLPRGRYLVMACDTLQNLIGLSLDGNGDGLPGGDALRNFVVEESPALMNPGFDDSIEHWALGSSPDDTTMSHAPLADADGALHSGALLATASAAVSPYLRLEPLDCVQLLPLTRGLYSNWRARLRHRVVSGSVRVSVHFWTGFSGDAGEPECVGPGMNKMLAFDADASPEFVTYDSGWRPFMAMPLAQLGLSVSSRNGQPFEILFDDIGLRFDSRVIFRDDFD